jgi:hypothetical protein
MQTSQLSQSSQETTLTRIVDDGGPLALEHPDGRLFVVSTRACMNPDCPCHDMQLIGRFATRPQDADQRLERGENAFTSTVDLESGDLKDTRARSSELVAWIERRIPELLDRFRDRFARIRGHHDRDQWQRQDRALLETDTLVPYCDAFPLDWDIIVALDGELYWAIDSYCLAPDCRCREVSVEFSSLKAGKPAGTILVDVDHWRQRRPSENDERVRPLWNRLCADGRKKEIARRFREMRRVARAIGREEKGAAPHEAGVKIGRNDPCPCGSGRKYKRCCLGKS